MKIFRELHDKDIFENFTPPHGEFVLRPTVKGIIVDNDNKVALLKAREHYLFPGGGVEGDETSQEAIKREIMEEIGCAIDEISSIGIANQY